MKRRSKHVHRMYTHSVHDVHTVFSQACTDKNACLWLKMSELYHLCAPKRIRHQVSHVIPLLISSTSSHFSSATARSTNWTARSSPRRRWTPRIFSTSSRNDPVGKSTLGRKAKLKNHSLTSIMKVPETCARTLPQVMSPKCLRPRSLRQFLEEVLWKTFISYTMYRQNLENKINKLQKLKKWRNLVKSRHKAHSITRCTDVICRENVLPPVPDALRRVCGKHCGLWSRRWRVTKVADFTTACPKSFWETRCNGRSGERGKCTNVSFILGSESFRETRCFVFTKLRWTEKPNLCSETPICRMWVELCSKAIKITSWIRQDQIWHYRM